MSILVLCTYGKNRSRYLAEYLFSKGYSADYAGVEMTDREGVQRKIDAADILVTAHPNVKEKLDRFFVYEGKRVIELDSDDRPEFVLPEKKALDGEDWLAFQQGIVYPGLKQQIDRFLPFEGGSGC